MTGKIEAFSPGQVGKNPQFSAGFWVLTVVLILGCYTTRLENKCFALKMKEGPSIFRARRSKNR